jgi:excisionase family DNA binding protein
MPTAAPKLREIPVVDPSLRKPPVNEPFSRGPVSAIPYPVLTPVAEQDREGSPIGKAGGLESLVAPDERLLNARQVAARLGVSERWVRDHTSRRNPKIRAVKLGPLIRYKRADVEAFMESLGTERSFRSAPFGV